MTVAVARPKSLPYRPCVGIALTNSRGLVWIGRRVGTRDSWQMPQGGIDAGESPAEAVMRELQEETGVRRADVVVESKFWYCYDLPPAASGRALRGRYRGQRQRWFLLQFTGSDDEIDINDHHPEFSAWRWAEPKDIVDLIVPFKRPVYEKVFAEFAPYLSSLAETGTDNP